MPILPAQPDLYPPDLWERDRAGDDPERRWWCLHAKPRQEKAAARHLHAHRLAYYLPQVIHEGRTPGGRKTRSLIPLFAGYLFFYGEDRQRVTALQGDHLVRTLEVGDQAGLEHDLRQVHRMLASGLPVVPEPTYPVGTRVRIVGGPLSGMVGLVARRGKRDQFTAIVQFLGQGATVDLQDWQVERAEDG